MNAFTSIETLTTFIHEETGMTGADLEIAVMLYSALYADMVTGSKAIGAYFITRAEEAFYSNAIA